jgi:receptor-type tyrosine-protein phosphatase gamma
VQLSTEGDDEQYDYVIKRFKIQSTQDDTEMDVRMLYNPDWPNLNNPTCLYDFLVKMHERYDGYRNGPIVVMDRYGGAEAATLCVVSSLAQQLECDKTANIYMYTKLYHNKRPGIWASPNDIAMIYKILAAYPSGFELLKHTALKTEFDDSLVTATPDLYSKTPDLFSKICSNGSISNHLGNGNGNGNTIIVKMKADGENGDLSAVVVTSDTADNLMLSK